MKGNEVRIEGFIGKDEFIKTNDAKSFVRFSLSVKKVNPKEGEQKYMFLNCVGFKDVSRNFNFKNGDLVVVTGSLNTETFTNKKGIEVTNHVIFVESLEKKFKDVPENNIQDVPF